MEILIFNIAPFWNTTNYMTTRIFYGCTETIVCTETTKNKRLYILYMSRFMNNRIGISKLLSVFEKNLSSTLEVKAKCIVCSVLIPKVIKLAWYILNSK